MVQNAIVKRVISGNVAEVSLLRQMECGLHCTGACAGCGQKPKEELLATASNAIGAKPGDFVEVEPMAGHNIGISVVTFLFPCVGLAAGYVIGQSAFQMGELAAFGPALVGLAAGFLPALAANHRMQHSKKPEFQILKFLR